ncbi:GIN domain-containing protein [Gluconobacter kondonii]|uniref:GIN domain-containing protein n=1 Tax=Gluconobacter kondonii TaxID=941463 RepID=UPI001980D20F|nr:DUF2807 domain-containing protein [Gluconobacter kondonii]
MRYHLHARLALLALLSCGAAPAPPAPPPAPPAPPAPPSPPAPSSFDASSTSSPDTLVIPATCLETLSVVSGPDAHIVSGSGSLKKHGERLTFTTTPQDCVAQDSAVVMVPARTSLDIQSSHNHTTLYRITGVNGDVTAESGHGDLDIDQASGLNLTMTGPGDVSVGRVTGRMTVQSLSSGDLQIGDLAASSASITAMSSGDIRVERGSVDVLTVRDYGSADITLNATARDADLTLLGSGDITLQKASETLKKRPIGSGTLSVEDTAGARITTVTTPDGSAILSDATRKVLDHLDIHMDTPEITFGNTSTVHHSSGHGVIGLLLKIFLIIWAVRLFRRYRRTGVFPFRGTLDKAAAGYAEGVRSWSRHRAAWQETPAASATAVVRDAVLGFRRPQPEPTEDFSRSVPPGHPLARLQDRLARMERRLGLIERCVTSSDFSLERQFRDLERTDGRRA